MKKKVVRALILCLAFLLLFALSLAGCGAKEDGEGTGEGTSAAEGSGGESSAAPETDDGAAYDGTYTLHNENPVLRAMSLTLSGRAWELQAPEEVLSGSFTVTGGRIALLYAVSPADSFGRELLGNGSAKEGDTVELFSGIVAPGTVYLETGAGLTASDFEFLFFLNGELPDVSGSGWENDAYDGGYFLCENGALDRDVCIRLERGAWTWDSYGESVGGAYGICHGRIFLFYTVSGADAMGEMFMEYENAKEGDLIYLYGGNVEEGALALDSYMGTLMTPEVFRAQ